MVDLFSFLKVAAFLALEKFDRKRGERNLVNISLIQQLNDKYDAMHNSAVECMEWKVLYWL